jgi:TRAP-type C4-dicarboxylate transport system permease small subunit
VEIWIVPISLSWAYIILYIGLVIVSIILGLLIKKYYKKKLSVMETESFSLEDAKKDV